MRRGLTIVVAGDDPERLASALRLVAAEAALGGRARLFLDHAAVPLATEGASADLVATAAELGARLIACQTGLSERGLSAEALPPAFETGGLVALLADLGDDRLLLV